MTKQEVLDLITANLATGSNITATEHRAVEEAIVNYFSSAIGNPIVAYGKIGPIDIKGSATSYTVTGNLLSATKVSTVADVNVVRVVFPTGLLSSQNFKVRIDIESNSSDVDLDNNLDPVLFRKVSTDYDRFDLILEETVASTASIYIHVEVMQLW